MTTPQAVIDANKRCRAIQTKHGHLFAPNVTTWFGNRWQAALKTDPQGSQLKYVLDELEELIHACEREKQYS